MTWRARQNVMGWLFAAPWLIGLVAFNLAPIVMSLSISFTDWNLLSPRQFIGAANYQKLVADPAVYQSLRVTLTYAVMSVGMQLFVGFWLAVLLNRKLRGIVLIKTIYYLPSILSGVAVAMLWFWLFNNDFGLFNHVLSIFGLPPVGWLTNRRVVLFSLALMSLWGVGRSIIINLAGLQSIPTTLYEAARIDGASTLRSHLAITIPMMSPIIFINLVMGLIGSFQTFTNAYLMTDGGPGGESRFLMLYIYFKAFQDFQLGYASALSWLLFVLVLAITLLVFWSGRYWVYYEGRSNK
jgi:multiple sugar transport system permease protein